MQLFEEEEDLGFDANGIFLAFKLESLSKSALKSGMPKKTFRDRITAW
jgi:hypothetical protein